MKNMKIYLSILILVFLCMLNLTAFAQIDSAGNAFLSEDSPVLNTTQRDLYWAGRAGVFDGYQVGKSFLAAGYSVNISSTEIGGSLRAGAFNIILNGVDVADNITMAANDLQMSGITASGVYAAGNTIYFSGTADRVLLAGNTVTIDGEISGDVDIYAKNINIGDNLKVGGTLIIESENQPVIPSGAEINTYVYNKTEIETVDEVQDTAENVTETVIENPVEKVTEKVPEKTPEQKKSFDFGSLIRSLFSTLLLAALIYLLLGAKELSKPGEMLLSRPFPMLGTGVAGLFVIPGVILILLFIKIGLPSAGLLALLFLMVCSYALVFTGMTVAKTLIPRFVKSSIAGKDWFCLLVGALCFWLLRKIPVFGGILQAVSIIYMLGYFLQKIYLRLKSSKKSVNKRNLKTVAESVVSDASGAENLPEESSNTNENEDPVQVISK